MLSLTRLRRVWSRLSDLSVLCSKSPVILYISSESTKSSTLVAEYMNTLSQTLESSEFVSEVNRNNIKCYKEDINHMSPELITKLQVKHVPVTIGILDGKKVAELPMDSVASDYLLLCAKLARMIKPTHLEAEEKLRALMKGDINELRSHVQYVRENHVQELEAETKLSRTLARATLLIHATPMSIKNLKDSIATVDSIIEKIKLDELVRDFNPKKYKPIDFGPQINAIQLDRKPPENSTPVAKLKFMKENLLTSLAIKSYHEKDPKTLQIAVAAYKVSVQRLKSDEQTIDEFKTSRTKEVLEALFSLYDATSESVMQARSHLEVIDGKRLLNALYESGRPSGGFPTKRRGFGGRYIWQGPDYRPKGFKPKDPQKYDNEWTCIQDSNLPTY